MLKDWRFWAAVVAVVLLIVAVVLYFVSPKFCYAASGLLVGALAGFIGGYFVGKKQVCK
jgi:nitrate/nitrite transporter NarK